MYVNLFEIPIIILSLAIIQTSLLLQFYGEGFNSKTALVVQEPVTH